mgnify:CR=1 FL=1
MRFVFNRKLNIANRILFLFMIFLLTTSIFSEGSSWSSFSKESEHMEREFNYRWGLEAINALSPGEVGEENSEEIVVAVIDSGIDTSVLPLKGKMWVNQDEIPGDNIDNDGNGYVDDVNGWDFWDEDPSSKVGSEINYHGTFIGGIIAASRDSSTGIGGVAPNVKLMDLRVLDSKGQFYSKDWSKLFRAIDYAVSNGARIINLSIYSTLSPPQYVMKEIQSATSNEVLVVGIPRNGQRGVKYFCEGEEMLVVGAMNKDEIPRNYSNSDFRIDLVAPGEEVLSLVPGGKTDRKSGASFAAAHVTGGAGLIMSIHPEISVQELKDLLKKSAKDLQGEGYDPKTGYGLLDIKKALSLLN